jgi:hypothetical protein
VAAIHELTLSDRPGFASAALLFHRNFSGLSGDDVLSRSSEKGAAARAAPGGPLSTGERRGQAPELFE